MEESKQVIEDLLQRIAGLIYENSVLTVKYKTLSNEIHNLREENQMLKEVLNEDNK